MKLPILSYILAGILVVCMGFTTFQAFKLERQATLLASAQSSLESRTEALETTTSTLALKTEIAKIKEDVSVLLAQSTIIIQDNARVNINNLQDIKRSMKDESKQVGKDVDALHPSIARFLREYEAKRIHTN